MNFLQLGQRLSVECGAANVSLTTMQNLTGEAARFYNWVGTAWIELQTLHDDWEWMRSSALNSGGVSFVPLSGVPVCPLGTGAGTVGLLATNFGGKWVKDSFRNYTTSVGFIDEIFIQEVSYDWWRDAIMYGAMRNVRTRPHIFAIAPDKSICVGPPSNGLYTVTGDYYAAPSSMSADIDTPTGLPNQYHMSIVYKAMVYYGYYEAAPEVKERGQDGWDEILTQLERQYGPRAHMAGALA